MGYDDVKEFGGRPYTGMRIGGRHLWHYTDAVWREEKVAPDLWTFTLTSVKRRDAPAPPGSGAPPLTEYHWYILADQWVRKIDQDSYRTFMAGTKHKIAHRRPHWSRWSDEMPGRLGSREAVIAALESTLDRLRTEREPMSLWAAATP